MNPVTLEKFKLTGAIARRIAEVMWGTGGTSAYKVPVKGAYYYACSGHGGFVAETKLFTEEQLKHLPTEELNILVQNQNGTDVVIAVSTYGIGYSWRQRYPKYYTKYSVPRWKKYKVVVLEEDCNWALFAHFLGIESLPKELNANEEDVRRSILRWNPQVLG